MKRLFGVMVAGAMLWLAFLSPAPVALPEPDAPLLEYPAFSTGSAFCPTWQADGAVESRIVAHTNADFTGRWFFDGDELAAFAGNGDDVRSWSADPGLQQGYTPIHLYSPEGVVSGGVRSSGNGFDAATSCVRIGSRDWAVGVGNTLEDNSTALMLYNPFPQSATVEVTVYSEQDLEVVSSLERVVVPPRTLRRFELSQQLRLREYLFFVVHEEQGRVVPSLERVSPTGARGVAVGAALGPRWFFPAGAPLGSSAELVLVNPSVSALSVEVDFFGQDGADLGVLQIVLPARSFEVLQVPAETAVAVNSDGSIGAGLTVEGPKGLGLTSGTQSVAQEWVLPGLSRGEGTQLAWVLNPGAGEVRVEYVVFGAGGASAPISVVVPPGRLLLVQVGATNSDSVVLTGDGAFVAGWTSEAPDDLFGLAVETGVPQGD